MIKINFNPNSTVHKARVIFKNPIVAKFYLLWKGSHAVDRYFEGRCIKLCVDVNPDIENYDVGRFIEYLSKHRLGGNPWQLDVKWVMEHWAYFSPTLRRGVEFKHKYRRGTKISKIY